MALTGCASKPAPVTPPPASPVSADSLESLRASFNQSFPDAKLAPVVEVLSNDPFLAATGDESSYPNGSFVTVINSEGTTVAHGRVIAHVAGQVHVRFEVSPSGRLPTVGDVLVKF
jgi:hypothetical protein